MEVNFSDDDYALVCKLAHAQQRWPAALVHDLVMAWARGVERRATQGTADRKASWQSKAPNATAGASATTAIPASAPGASKVR